MTTVKNSFYSSLEGVDCTLPINCDFVEQTDVFQLQSPWIRRLFPPQAAHSCESLRNSSEPAIFQSDQNAPIARQSAQGSETQLNHIRLPEQIKHTNHLQNEF